LFHKNKEGQLVVFAIKNHRVQHKVEQLESPDEMTFLSIISCGHRYFGCRF
jgi:hypothetical protein